ncbi:hypothetical protein ACFQWF_01405 [Methylorubrum suomiense]
MSILPHLQKLELEQRLVLGALHLSEEHLAEHGADVVRGGRIDVTDPAGEALDRCSVLDAVKVAVFTEGGNGGFEESLSRLAGVSHDGTFRTERGRK